MKNSKRSSTCVALMVLSLLGATSCSSTNKPVDDGTTFVSIRPGEAGGVIEDTFTTSATVRAVDASTRKITLATSDGTAASFTAGPQVRNFEQIRVGDTVNATFVERIYAFVRSGDDPKSVTHATALAAAPKGAKPGMLVAEAYEIVATVQSIDPVNRKVTIQFVDGSTKSVTPRADVDLMRYKVGDSLVIQVSAAVSVLVEKP